MILNLLTEDLMMTVIGIQEIICQIGCNLRWNCTLVPVVGLEQEIKIFSESITRPLPLNYQRRTAS